MVKQAAYYLDMQNIVKSFPGVQVLKGVSFQVARGEIHALLGGNGAGKSTFMNILGGLLQKDGGQIFIDGKPVEIRTPSDAKALGISFIHQELKLFSYLSIAENICISNLPTRGPLRFVDERAKNAFAAQMLSKVGLSLDPQTQLGKLSIAQQQLVEIAKAISTRTEILILDEPTSSLTGQEIQRLFEVMQNLKQQGVCIIFISHKLEEIFASCDRVTILRDGQNVCSRPVEQITEQEIVQQTIGKQIDRYFPKKQPPEALEPVLTVRGLSNRKIHQVSFQIHAGEILGLFGLVGAGRSELARALFGLDPICQGELLLGGRQLSIQSCKQAIDSGIAFLTENRRTEGFIPEMGIRQNLSLTILDKLSRWGVLNRKKDRESAQRAFEHFQIVAAGPEQIVKKLSGGNQQKVVLAKWMATDVRVLILDEPTRGVDVGAKAEIYDLIARMAREQRIAILVISSEAPEILGIAHRILVMHGGRISGEFTAQQATQEKLLACAMKGAQA